jgi:hypothetical protein
MRCLIWIIRKLFLVKEIISQNGELHFQRYRLLSTPWFNVYLHRILRSDQDAHFHDHPWHFRSLILRGGYQEHFTWYPDHKFVYSAEYEPGSLVVRHAQDAHQLTLLTPEVWTLVLTSGRERVWGYQTPAGWIDFLTYRQLKRDGKLPT